MKVLFTGASSPLGARVLAHLLESTAFDEIICTVYRRNIALRHPKLRTEPLDLAGPFALDERFDDVELLIHFASVTHASNPGDYRRVNYEGSLHLVEQARLRGCRKMFYLSTRCVGPRQSTLSCGPYAESKRALEDALIGTDWASLVVVRPAEVYGAGGTEGLDRFIRLARAWRVVPMLLGDRRIRFAPLHFGDFVHVVTSLLDDMPDGTHTFELCGPQILDGPALARTLARKFRAVPIPVWYPLLDAILVGLDLVRVRVIATDQRARLLGDKSADFSSPALVSGRRLTSLADSIDDDR
jgi:nucleoside-diphosphate-sugar epimerase